MRIAIVLPTPPAYSETFFNSKIKGLQKNGNQIILVTSASSQTFNDCKHHKHPKVYSNSFRQVLAMLFVYSSLLPSLGSVYRYVQYAGKDSKGWKRLLEKIYLNAALLKLKTDWIHFGFATMAIDREHVANAIGAQMAVSFRGYDIGVYPLKNPGCYDLLWKNLDKVHFISDDLYKKALQLGLPDAIPHQKITPAIDSQFFEFNTIKNSYLNESEVIHFCTIGRLHWKKGYIDMLHALRLLKGKGIKFTYHIIGSGVELEPIAYAAYKFNLTDEVVFEGKCNHQEVKSILQKSHIYLQYSIQEGFCNSVLEAQAMGKLCIVSDAEGLNENIKDGYSGWVVPKLNPRLLADKILEVIHLPKAQQELFSLNARQRVEEHFNLEKQNKAFNDFYINTYIKVGFYFK